MNPTGFDIVVVALVALVILTIALGVRTIPQGFNYTVERFGRYSRTLGAGLGLIIPYIERIGHKVNVMEQVLDIPSQEAITKDNAGVRIDAAAFYQVLDAAKACYEVASLDQALIVLTMTNIRTVVGSMDLDQLLSHRDEINERLLRVMDAAASPWGVKVTRIEIRDILPPADIAGAMNRQLGTKVFWVQTGGYDTHAGQGVNQGAYFTLMATLDDGLRAFHDDLRAQSLLNSTLVMIYTEFGRRITENGSEGTDHGAGGVMMLLGGLVRGGLYGTAPNLSPDPANPTLENNASDVKYETDFRSVYARVIDNWLGGSSVALLGADFKAGAPAFL